MIFGRPTLLRRLSRLSRLRPLFAMAILMALGSITLNLLEEHLVNAQIQSPSQIDGSRLKPGEVPANAAAGAQLQSKREQAIARLFKDIDNLIPGEFEKGSAEEKVIRDVAEAFQAGKAKEVVAMVEKLSQNPGYPPSDVILAALSYTNNDQKTGLLLLERAAVKHPNDPSVYSAFARLAVNSGRTTDAKVLFEKLQSVVAAGQLSDVAKDFYVAQYLDGMIDIAISQKRLDDARKLLEQQRVRLPEHPKVLMVSAELEFKQGKLDRCLAYLKTMKSKYPKSRVPEAIIASWYQRTGDAKSAETWIRKAAQTYPKDPQVQLEFASWALNEEDFPTANGAVKRAEDVLMETPFSKNLKAKIAFARESYAVAEAHYESLVANQPMESDTSNMYALCLVESNNRDKYAKALGIAQRNLRAMPNNRVALASLGYIHTKGGDLEQAKLAFGKALQINGNSPEIDFFVATYLAKTGENEKALNFINRALQQDGLFLYRSSALKLKKELEASQLPTPGAAKPAKSD